MNTFNIRLKQLRESAGMTQEGLARSAGLSTSTISKLEQGGIDPGWSTVLTLAKALGVAVQAFADCDDIAAEPATEEPAPKPKKPAAKKKGGAK